MATWVFAALPSGHQTKFTHQVICAYLRARLTSWIFHRCPVAIRWNLRLKPCWVFSALPSGHQTKLTRESCISDGVYVTLVKLTSYWFVVTAFPSYQQNRVNCVAWCVLNRFGLNHANWDVERKSTWLAVVLLVLVLPLTEHNNLAQQPSSFMDRNSKRKSIQTPSCTEKTKTTKTTHEKDNTEKGGWQISKNIN